MQIGTLKTNGHRRRKYIQQEVMKMMGGKQLKQDESQLCIYGVNIISTGKCNECKYCKIGWDTDEEKWDKRMYCM
jgi:hypothetical protein